MKELGRMSERIELSPINIAGVREMLEDYEDLGAVLISAENQVKNHDNPLVREFVSGLRGQKDDLGKTLTLLGQRKQVASIDAQLAKPSKK